MKKLLYILFFCSAMSMCANLRMTKNEKEQFMSLVAEPMRKIEQKIDQINQAASQIQNFIIDNYNQPLDQQLLDQYHKILQQLGHIGLLLEAFAYVLQAQVQATQDIATQVVSLQDQVATLEAQLADLQAVIGSPSDVSVGEEEFNSVQDIDDAQLSAISWLKTIFREQLYEKFIS